MITEHGFNNQMLIGILKVQSGAVILVIILTGFLDIVLSLYNMVLII